MPTTPIATDALVIGAGPVGLWQAFQLGLQDIRCHVVDALPHAGGQTTELYPDKPIYDIPGLPVCTGRELTERLLQQLRPLQPQMHLGQSVTTLARHLSGGFEAHTSAGTVFQARTVFIAAGVGAFQARRLKLDGIDAFEPAQLHHRLNDPAAFAGQRVVVHGGDDLAIDTLLRLADAATPPAGIWLLHRRDVLHSDDAAALARAQALITAGRVQLVVGQPVGFNASAGQLHALRVVAPDGLEHVLPLDHLVVALGLSPRLGPIADWGLAMERKQLVVNPADQQTSEPGVFAVGDINTYPGKKKLILCGFHEATLAAFGAAALLRPDERIPLQYTTTSPRLQRLLGVAPG